MSDTTLIKYLGEEGTSALIDKIKQILSHKPDFAQNDPTAEDYIKNRTHWMEYEREELLTDVVMTYEEGNEPVYETDVVFVKGEEYIVTFEGKEYKCKAKTLSPQEGIIITYIGNIMTTDADAGTDTGEPFVIATTNIQPGIMLIAWDVTVTNPITFSLTHLITKSVHQLDQKYIPNSDWNAKEGETGHILNRTHYAFNNYILPLTTFEVDFGQVMLQTVFNFEEGKTYFVNYNGVEYECIASRISVEGMEMVYIGDITMSNPPFVIGDIPEGAGADFKSMISIGDGSEQITISVYTSDFKKLDNRFLELDWLPIIVEGEEIIVPTEIITGNGFINGLAKDMINVGETYVVYFNGKPFRAVAKSCEYYDGSYSTVVYLGNGSFCNHMDGSGATTEQEDTGEDFCILISEFLQPILSLKDGVDYTEVILSIAKPIKTPNKLPNEYLDMDWYASDICVEEEILPETELTSVSHIITNQLTETLVPNQLYVIYINDKRYECISIYNDTYATEHLSIGNSSINNDEGKNTGEPFVITYASNDGAYFIYPTFVEGNTIRICKGSYEINKLPNKYLDLAWLPVMLPSEELFYEKTTGSGAIGSATDFDWSLFEINESVIVYCNDERYETKVSHAEGNKYIGSAEYDSNESVESFYINQFGNNTVFYTKNSNSTLKVYKLSAENLVPNKIPAEFLPDDIGGDVAFYVTVTANEDGIYSADKTCEEIANAINDGQLVYCRTVYNDMPIILSLTVDQILPGGVVFTGFIDAHAFNVIILSNGSVDFKVVEVGRAEDIPKVDDDFDRTSYNAIVNNIVTRKFEEVDTALTNRYLKSETYSQSEVNSLLSSIPKFSISVVSSLPTANISNTTVYLVPSDEEENDLYTEYIYVNNKWETLGRQKMDLSGFVTKEEVKNHTQVQIIRWEEND